MDFSVALENIEWWGVVLAFVVSMVWGTIYYNPAVAGKQWSKLTKVKMGKEDFNAEAMGYTMLAAALMAFVMGLFQTEVAGVVDGAFTGFVIGAGFAAPAMATHYLFAKRRKKLLLIDAFSVVVNLTLMGMVFGIVG